MISAFETVGQGEEHKHSDCIRPATVPPCLEHPVSWSDTWARTDNEELAVAGHSYRQGQRQKERTKGFMSVFTGPSSFVRLSPLHSPPLPKDLPADLKLQRHTQGLCSQRQLSPSHNYVSQIDGYLFSNTSAPLIKPQ